MIIDEEVEDFLEHFGVKGMRWGVHNDRPSGVSRSTNREAGKDAKEFARAKLFYGEGAGTRRKLIKAKVEAKQKHNPGYAKAFEQHLGNQNLGKHADKAQSERGRKDKRKAIVKTTGALARSRTGEMGTKAAYIAIGLSGAAYLSSPKGQFMRQKLAYKGANLLKSPKVKTGADYVMKRLNKLKGGFA